MAQFWQQVVSGLASGGIYASLALALLIVLNGATQWIWGGAVRKFPSPFSTRPIHVGSAAFSIQDIGIVGVCLAAVALLTLFFRFTKLGLGLRAAAVNPEESRLVGVRVGWMLALGWGLSAVLGGLESPVGAVVGGLALGVVLNLLGTYASTFGGEMRLVGGLAVILAVLLVRPTGLFGRTAVRRV